MVQGFERFCDRLALLAQRGYFLLTSVGLLLLWRLLPHSPADPDLFARLGMGRLVQSHGAVPLHDPFAFTEKLPMWIDHEWLSGVFFLWVVQMWGDVGLIGSKIAFGLISTFFLIKAAELHNPNSRGRNTWVALCLLHASYLWGSTLRCQAFTYLFLSYLLFALAQYQMRNCHRYIWLMPLISIPWINLHGGWALGMAVLCIFTVTSALSRKPFAVPLIVAALSGTAILFTPYEPRAFFSYLSGALGHGRESISEWTPLVYDLDQCVATSIFALLMLAGSLCRPTTRDLRALVLLCFSAYCGFRHARLLGFFMFCAAVYGPTSFSTLVTLFTARFPDCALKVRRAVTAVCAVLITCIALDVARISIRPKTFSLDLSGYPTGAIDFLAGSSESGRLLIDFNNGSFALWRLYPRFRISLDGRYEEVYPESTVREVSEALLYNTTEGKRALAKVDPTHILIPSNYLQSVGIPSPDWRIAYDDRTWAVLRKGQAPEADTLLPSTDRTLWQPMF